MLLRRELSAFQLKRGGLNETIMRWGNERVEDNKSINIVKYEL